MNVTEIAKVLRETADKIDDMQKSLTLPVENVDLKKAFSTLRAVVGNDAYLTIDVQFGQMRSSNKIKVEWSIYDGKKSYNTVSTLAEAVNRVIKDHEPEKDGDAEADMNAVEEALAEPLPM